MSLETKHEELKKELKDAKEKSLFETMNDLVQRNEALEAIVLALQKEMEEMLDELIKYKTTCNSPLDKTMSSYCLTCKSVKSKVKNE